MSDIFIYNDEKHEYTLNSVKMTGVTSVLGAVGGAGGLPQWAAKMATEYIRENVAYAIPGPDGGYWAVKPSVVGEAKTAHAKKRDKAADDGTDGHKVSELFEIGEDISVQPKEAIERAAPYLDWYKGNVKRTYFVERPLFSKEWFCGGTPDGGFQMNDGKNLINDKKFKKSLYDNKPHWQMAAYRKMWEEMKSDTTTKIRLEWKDSVEEYDTPQEYLKGLADVQWDGSVVLLMSPGKSCEPLYRYAYDEDVKSFEASYWIYRHL